jgi:UDP-N-acetylmuramoylalanine--D-glutamate ligase
MQTYARALILGRGRSGQAAEALLRAEGTETLMLDQETSDFENFRFQISNFQPDTAVVSPGFALTHPWIEKLREQDIRLISELELGWQRRKSRVIAVTGSNGKSTVVKWITEALNANGQSAVACGNYGFPVSAAVMQTPAPDWLVIEVSSFQLETVQEFRPDIGVLLNILPNHLDRHGSMEAYRALKLKLFARQTANDAAVVPVDFVNDVPGAKTFGAGGDYQYLEGRVGDVDLRGTLFANEVLGPAAAAVTAVCEACGLPPSAVTASARVFEPLPHRMEPVAEIGGVQFIDDSKATNLAAMCAAVRMCPGRIHLIAGGRSKEKDFSFAKDLLAERVSHLYLIGEASGMMQAAWGETVDCTLCETVEKAVSAVWGCTEPGDTVLFSPACTSFDQFCDFNERGEVFVREVSRLKRKGC